MPWRLHAEARAVTNGPVELLRVRGSLGGAVEHVAGARALGQDEQRAPGRGRLLEPCEAQLPVAVELPEPRLDLGDADEHAGASVTRRRMP